MTGRNRRNQAREIGMSCCRNLQQFALAARAASGLRPRLGDWESSVATVALAVEVLALNLPKSTSVFAKRCSPYQVVDHRVQHFAGFEYPADEPAPILPLDFGRAISHVPGTITRALCRGPSQDSVSEE